MRNGGGEPYIYTYITYIYIYIWSRDVGFFFVRCKRVYARYIFSIYPIERYNITCNVI